MKLKSTLLLIIGLQCTLSACNDTNSSTDSIIDAAKKHQSKDAGNAGDNKCLLDYQHKYDQLVSTEDILSITGFSNTVLKTNYRKVLDNPEYHSYSFNFKNKRMGKMKHIKQPVELPDFISIGGITAMSMDYFKNSYRKITDEENKAAKEAIKNVAEGKSGNKEAEDAVKKAKDMNISEDQIKKTGNDLVDVFKGVSEGYEPVDGLGDIATWNSSTKTIYVLQKGVKFEVSAEVSNDNEINKNTAIKVANIILNKCK